MAFNSETTRVANRIGDYSVVMTGYEDTDKTSTATYEIQVKCADGSMFALKQGNLVPELPQVHIDAMLALMAYVEERSQEFLPE